MSHLRDTLNALITAAEESRGLIMPRIGIGHAGYSGGIFSLLQDPGGVYTASSGAVDSHFVDIDNDDPTAKWCKELYERLGIPKSKITPWNALGGYCEKPSVATIMENLPLCQSLLDIAAPVALIAQGRWAQKMADRLQFASWIFRVPHPSRLGRASYKEAGEDIETAFHEAFTLCKTNGHGGTMDERAHAIFNMTGK